MCNLSELIVKQGREEGREEGLQLGAMQEKINTARRLLNRGYCEQEVAEDTELPLEQVKALNNELMSKSIPSKITTSRPKSF